MRNVYPLAVKWELPETLWPSVCFAAAVQPVRGSRSHLGIQVEFAEHQSKRKEVAGWKRTEVPHRIISLTARAWNLLKWAHGESPQRTSCSWVGWFCKQMTHCNVVLSWTYFLLFGFFFKQMLCILRTLQHCLIHASRDCLQTKKFG